MGWMKVWTESLLLCTLKLPRHQAGGLEVDGFAGGSGHVGFSEGLRHRLQEEGQSEEGDRGEGGGRRREILFLSGCYVI